MRKKVLNRAFIAFLAVIALIAVSALSACGDSAKLVGDTAPQNLAAQDLSSETPDNSTETTAIVSENSSGETNVEIKITDGIGTEITLSGPAEKVIVFAPSALEIINGLDAMGRVAGVDCWSVETKEPLAEGFECFGNYSSLNIEKIVTAAPDIIFGLNGWAEADIQKISDLGIKVYIIDANTVSDVYKEIVNMGRILGLEEAATKISNELKKQVDEIALKLINLDGEQKPKVFYEVWDEPLMGAGKNTFINDLIKMSGGVNIVAADGLEGWPEYSMETLIKNDPDILIAPVSVAPDAEMILSDPKLSGIKAIKDKKVYIVPDNLVSRPSQNIIKGLNLFAKAIHPEIFGEFEVQQ